MILFVTNSAKKTKLKQQQRIAYTHCPVKYFALTKKPLMEIQTDERQKEIQTQKTARVSSDSWLTCSTCKQVDLVNCIQSLEVTLGFVVHVG